MMRGCCRQEKAVPRTIVGVRARLERYREALLAKLEFAFSPSGPVLTVAFVPAEIGPLRAGAARLTPGDHHHRVLPPLMTVRSDMHSTDLEGA